ncbi:hypothetical protein [Haloarcula sp. JP-L23]|uniref:hypothetical protein n=1 Tax=Haloarcula sp. JP-L23 TaxID=2716717 RepID=UPI00140ED958|nr:hypothetical protein G9465_09995 [Haloarcula sp. JP-L23]
MRHQPSADGSNTGGVPVIATLTRQRERTDIAIGVDPSLLGRDGSRARRDVGMASLAFPTVTSRPANEGFLMTSPERVTARGLPSQEKA